MARAVFNDTIIAESDSCRIVDGNVYFPPETVKKEFLRESDTRTECPSRGTASYFDIVVGDKSKRDAAWCYADPRKAAQHLKGYIAFWRGVRIEH